MKLKSLELAIPVSNYYEEVNLQFHTQFFMAEFYADQNTDHQILKYYNIKPNKTNSILL